jgi:hypothetical protein
MPFLPRLAAVAALVLAGGCTTTPTKIKVYQDEGFESGEAHSRLFDAPVEQTCEAARRALLSQGYVVSVLKPDAINGTKSFQPEGDVHVQIEFHVVCASDGGKIATAYVSALQDRYTLKKSPNSASVGVSAIGSLSIPFMSSDDSLVKVASETIPAGPFYDRFFTLMHRYLREQTATV